MRNEEKWENKYRQQVVDDFPKRIRKDLEIIPVPDNLPKLESLYIQGPVGTGKTLWASWLYLEAWKQKYLNATAEKVLFVSVTEFLNLIKKSYNNPDLDEQQLLDEYSTAGFLVLDDLGAERVTEWALPLLYLLIFGD